MENVKVYECVLTRDSQDLWKIVCRLLEDNISPAYISLVLALGRYTTALTCDFSGGVSSS